eukprot:TRINITY_DN7871_c0_g1_i1.p1 TRINITY_DN7871_c0_g1~~TRINITY_DN7871_c0_g1_i1.p1  ORF type:complete len:402 (+),score=62.95 TRINITY_DN7871_c0_g1_i1:42-1208(+)
MSIASSVGITQSCPQCGNVYASDSLFCRRCGQKRSLSPVSRLQIPVQRPTSPFKPAPLVSVQQLPPPWAGPILEPRLRPILPGSIALPRHRSTSPAWRMSPVQLPPVIISGAPQRYLPAAGSRTPSPPVSGTTRLGRSLKSSTKSLRHDEQDMSPRVIGERRVTRDELLESGHLVEAGSLTPPIDSDLRAHEIRRDDPFLPGHSMSPEPVKPDPRHGQMYSASTALPLKAASWDMQPEQMYSAADAFPPEPAKWDEPQFGLQHEQMYGAPTAFPPEPAKWDEPQFGLQHEQMYGAPTAFPPEPAKWDEPQFGLQHEQMYGAPTASSLLAEPEKPNTWQHVQIYAAPTVQSGLSPENLSHDGQGGDVEQMPTIGDFMAVFDVFNVLGRE